MVKNPRRPPRQLAYDNSDIHEFQDVLWRIHRTSGEYALAWDQLRSWGPSALCRFDPHPMPPGDHVGHAVMYAASDLRTALTEVFQGTRRVDTRTGSPAVVSWTPARTLRLLDLTRDWALRNGASASLGAGRRDVCRNWARRIHQEFPDLDGLYTASTMTARPVVVFAPGGDAFPPRPAFSSSLDTDEMVALVAYELTGLDYSLL